MTSSNGSVQAAIDSLIADFNDHPDLPEVVFVVGEQYYNDGFRRENEGRATGTENHFIKAITVWERIITELPPNATYTLRAYIYAAACYRRLGKYEKAIEYYQKVVDSWPEHEYADYAQYFIGEYYEKSGNDDGPLSQEQANLLAEQAYKAVHEKYPGSTTAPIALLRLGRLHFRAAQWAEAASYFEQFLDAYPDHENVPRALYRLGSVYEKLGQVELAIQAYERFMDMADPNDCRLKTVQAKLEELEGQN